MADAMVVSHSRLHLCVNISHGNWAELMTCFYQQSVISLGNDILGLLNPEVKSLASVFPHLGVSCHGKKFGPDNQMITDQLERQRISQPL